MNWQPFETRIPAHGTSLADDSDLLSRSPAKLRERLRRLGGRFFRPALAASDASEFEQPIRAELFSIERLEQHAACLARNAARHNETDERAALEPRLRDNHRALRAAY